MRWYKLAAGQGNANAQTYLGLAYANSEGVVQDFSEAARWYRLAAAQGNVLAQYILGTRYMRGQGIAQDYTRAHMWFNLAGVKGDSDAIKNRDIVAKLMTPQQVAEAQKLARECQARHFKNCD